MHLDQKLNFNKHEKTAQAKKEIDITRKLFNILVRNALVTIYKSFVRPQIDYCCIDYDQPNN